MEEAHFLSHTFTSSEATQNHNYRGPGPGQVSFRLLCHVHNAGGVIGSSGTIIKNLETLTGSSIRFEEGLPNCNERVVNIIGDAVIVKSMYLGGGGEEMVEVSKAQEALMRVFERVLEVEGNCGNDSDSIEHYSIGCRLLAPTGRIGAVMGKGGKIVDGIRRNCGARIRVLKKEQTPACAAPEEELIQIMGGVFSVKKALLAVSRRLQDRALGESVAGHMSSCGVSHNSHADFIPNNFERTLNLGDDYSPRKVVFRLLCSNGIAGGVIGKGANIVKFLEKETCASIKFTSPVSGSKERIAIISSLEKPDPLFSPAQLAIIRVFCRCVEVGLEQGVISSLSKRDNVIARILIPSSHVGCLMDEGARVALDTTIAAPGVDIQLLGSEFLPNCAEDDDNIVQITGEYETVKSALFQVTGRLRQNFFSIGSSPNGRETDSTESEQLKRLSYIDEQLNHLGFVQKSSVTDSQELQLEQANTRENTQRHRNSAQGFTISPCKHKSNIRNEVSNQTVEVIVPSILFGSVYGENGSNLARLKEISGATIILQDPCARDGNGKVVISGTSERIRIAQSLLQAFISF